jgi:DNA helicase-2/ATP-dependent DNA helicase PcrA
MDYLDGLNAAQREAVVNIQGPTMVIAGAGSGKTRVLTYRIAHLINSGVNPGNILALTFTNKAAREMKDRIAKVVGPGKAQSLWMGTFHSVFAKILRIEAEKIGYPNNFTIYDTADSKNAIKSILKEMNLDEKIYKPGLVYNRISSAKNNLISSKNYAQNSDYVAEDRMSGKPRIAEVFAEYDLRCFKAGAMDFDDLLFKTNVLLRDYPEVLYKYQHRFHYILVDEYQDTNYSQYLIIKKLAALNENICVVGDDAQSIYGFRGADIQNILNYRKDYPDVKTFKLEQNYRSTKVIVNAANSVISKNAEQLEKTVWTANDEGEKIKVVRAASDNEEGQLIAQSIFDTKMNLQAHNKDIAILYRTNAQSRSFEEALRKLNIAYRIYGGLSFYQRKEIKDLLAYFRLTANPNDEEALKRIINYPKRGIGDTTVDALVVASAEKQTGIWSVLEEPERHEVKLNSGAQNKVRDFCNMIKSFRIEMTRMSAFDLASHIAASTTLLKDLYDDKSPEGVSRYENVQELLNGIKEFTEDAPEGEQRTLADFLIDVALLTDADEKDPDGNDKVTMMTIHAAKGLEFPYVYIVGMEENLFPSQLSLSSDADLEEERRLFYVALTRAEKRAMISYALTRYRWGNLTHGEPSRFIDEIDAACVDMPLVQPVKQPGFEDLDFGNGAGFQKLPFQKKFGANNTYAPKKPAQHEAPKHKVPDPKNLKKLSAASPVSGGTPSDSICVGQNVMHEKFGKGKVIAIEGAEPNTKATIFFPSEGQKQLLLRFAKLTVID